MLLWLGLVLLRISWAVLPQTGYIHPDEFFQTVEVVAGDALDVSIERTWEFNTTFPLRSILLPKFLFHPGFRLLKIISENTDSFRISGWHVLAASRLTITLLSVVVDVCMIYMCSDFNIHGQAGIMLLASSYVTLTYLTHTFSNSIEALLLTVVIMLIIKSVKRDLMCKHEKIEKDKLQHELREEKLGRDSEAESDSLNDSYGMLSELHAAAFDLRRRKRKQSEETSSNIPDTENSFEENGTESEKSQLNGQTDEKENNSLLLCALLAVLNTAGIFNRPTFVLFSIAPFLWWISQCFSNITLLISRMAIFIIVSIVTAGIFCCVDTLYYNDLANMDDLFSKLVFTPLNFILYNTKFDNLAQHGRHPFYLHFFVNIPLLFGPLSFYILKGVLRKLKSGFHFLFGGKGDKSSKEDLSPFPLNRKWKELEIGDILLWFVLAPVIFLSFFPHQEPRFLIPLLPLVILYVVSSNHKLSKIFWGTFFVFNIILAVLYGVLHQGGLVPCLFKLHNITHSKSSESQFNIIFSHTYMPPKHPLLIEKKHNINIYDLKGSEFSVVHDLIFQLRITDLSQNLSDPARIFIVIPGTLVRKFKQEFSGRLKVKTVEKFFPHLSLEDPPVLRAGVTWVKMKNMLSLFLIKVENV